MVVGEMGMEHIDLSAGRITVKGAEIEKPVTG
jgi:hypothetical protein